MIVAARPVSPPPPSLYLSISVSQRWAKPLVSLSHCGRKSHFFSIRAFKAEALGGLGAGCRRLPRLAAVNPADYTSFLASTEAGHRPKDFSGSQAAPTSLSLFRPLSPIISENVSLPVTRAPYGAARPYFLLHSRFIRTADSGIRKPPPRGASERAHKLYGISLLGKYEINVNR